MLARWWPLPAPEDCPWLEALLPDDGPASQRRLAKPWRPTLPVPGPLAATAGASGEQVASWVRQAVAPGGDLRLALRCHEPADGRRRWTIELLLGPAADPSLLLPLADFWACSCAWRRSWRRCCGWRRPPSGRAALLAEAGFGLLLPSGLRQVSRLGLRAQIPAARGKGGKAAPAGSGAAWIWPGCSSSSGRRCWAISRSARPTWRPCSGPPP